MDRLFVWRRTAAGVLCGVLIAVSAYMLQLLVERELISWAVLVRFHRLYPLFYAVDLLPVILGVVFWLVSRRLARLDATVASEQYEMQQRNEQLLSYVHDIGVGKAVDYTPRKGDTLGNALVELQRAIAVSRQEEQTRRQEDARRNWTAEGLAKFGEILRTDTKSLQDLAYLLISQLVRYVDANQCGFYLVEDDAATGTKYFSLLACYAYDRKKFSQQRLEWGDGLVGACALEGVTTHLDHVPDGYLQITSGLGQATPQNLLLVPVKQDEAIFAVLELAAFTPFAPHVVTFIEKVAASIASTLSSKRINMRTTELLADTRKQAKVLAEQEEQMRQNMEELQATQEEAARQNETFISFTNSVNHTLIRAEYDMHGILLYANEKFLQKLEYESQSQVKGKHISLFISPKDRETFAHIWDDLVQRDTPFEGDMKHVTRTGKDLWTIATYTRLPGHEEHEDRILFLAIDTTRDKKQNLDWQGQIEALNRMSLKVEISPLGDVTDVNQQFLDTVGYAREEILRKPLSDIVPKMEQRNLEHIIDTVGQGEAFKGVIRVLTKAGEDCWLRVTIATVNDMYGDISKLILIANDMTREKLMEIELKRQNEQMKQQEEQLRQNELQLNRKLREAREEVKNQFKEIEKVQIRNEKTLEGFLDAIITTDQDGVVEFFNKAAEELFGIERSEVLGQNVRLLFPDDLLPLQSDDFLKRYLDPEGEKIVGERREVQMRNSAGEDNSVLMLLSEARVGRKVSYTAFIQQISVDLF